jgi:hypothetical protein
MHQHVCLLNLNCIAHAYMSTGTDTAAATKVAADS